MIENKTTNKRLLNMFKKAKKLLRDGNENDASHLIWDAEREIRESSAKFELTNTPSFFHHSPLKQYGLKIYSKLYCLIYDLQFNIQQGMKREALLKLDKIISTNMYSDIVQEKITLADSKREVSYKFRNDNFINGQNRILSLLIDLKGQVI